MLRTFLLLILPLALWAQQANFEKYSVSLGLAQSQVYAIAQDHTGFLWLGTRGGGLSRFDGKNFTNFSTQHGLPSNFIHALAMDSLHQLWIGTENGLSCYSNSTFVNYQKNAGLPFSQVNTILPLPTSEILIGTEYGLFILQGDTIVRFGRKAQIPFTRINSLFRDAQGYIYTGTDFGFYRFKYTTSISEFSNITTKEGLTNNTVQEFTQDSKGLLYVATYGGGISVFQNLKFQYSIKQQEGLPTNTVHSLYINREQELWAGTGSGLARFQLNSNSKPNLLATYTDQEGLSNNIVVDIFQDSYHTHWFGTSGGGLNKLGSERFLHYPAIPELMGAWVFAIHQDQDSTFWFATSEGGVTRYSHGKYKRFSQRDGFTAHNCKTIFRDRQNRIWFGTVGDGLYVYENNRFRHFTTKQGLPSRFITSITQDSSGNIWIGTAGAGIATINPNYSFKKYTEKNGLIHNRINQLTFDSSGTLWIATVEGLAIAQLKNSKWEFSYFPSLLGNVRNVISTPYGIVAGIADKGIAIIQQGKTRWIKTELNSLNIYSILWTTPHIWVGTEKGIERLTWNGNFPIKEKKYYGPAHGFSGIETIQNSIYQDFQKRIWFGTIAGATCYQPSRDLTSSIPPQLSLTNVNLFFSPLRSKTTQHPEDLHLHYFENQLSFEFTAIETRFPASIRYKWKLDGIDSDWSPLSLKNTVSYSNLPSGHFTFYVQAYSENGTPSNILIQQIHITPAYWNTWWFRGIILVTVMGILYALYRWRWKTKLEKSKQDRERIELQRNLLELEQKSLRLQMNPHFLFNCLNSIKGLIAENDADGAKHYLNRFAKLMRNMLEHSRKEWITLEEELTMLQLYVDLEKISSSKQYNFSIEIDELISPSTIQLPPLLLQPFIENAIWHGMHGKIENGKIEIHIFRKNDQLNISIKDNGIGREESNRLKREGESVHKSTALSIATERLYLLDKKLGTSNSSITIQDIKDNGIAKGTHILIILPIE